MSDGNRDDHYPLRRLIDLFGLLAAIGVAAFLFIGLLERTATSREAIARAASEPCAQSDKQACKGSYADIRSASAAEDLLDLSVLQFLAGIVGIYFVALTLQATRAAVREANDATETAREAVHITREGNALQHRAYIAITQINHTAAYNTVVSTPTVTISGDWFVVVPKITNVGSTPAINCVTVASWAVLPAEEPPVFVPPTEFSGPTIFPQMQTGFSHIYIPMAEARRVYGQRELALFITLCVDYSDVFSDDRRRTMMCVTCLIGMHPDRWRAERDLFSQSIEFNSSNGYSETS